MVRSHQCLAMPRIPSESDYAGRGIFPGCVWLTTGLAIFWDIHIKDNGTPRPPPPPKLPQQFIIHLLDSQPLKRVIGSTIANIFMYSYDHIQLLCSYTHCSYDNTHTLMSHAIVMRALESSASRGLSTYYVSCWRGGRG